MAPGPKGTKKYNTWLYNPVKKIRIYRKPIENSTIQMEFKYSTQEGGSQDRKEKAI